MSTSKSLDTIYTPSSNAISSDLHYNWALSALRLVSQNGFNCKTNLILAKVFIEMLLSIDTSNHKTVFDICDDSLGGYTSIDPQKFAKEFIARRLIDKGRFGWMKPVALATTPSSTAPIKLVDNKFVLVKKKKGKKTINE